MKNKFLVIIISLIYSLFFVGDVSAKEISQFCDYTDPCLTTEKIDEWIENIGIDTTIYDSYFISIAPDYNTLYFNIIFYDYDAMLNNKIYINEKSSFSYLVFETTHYRYNSFFNNSSKLSLSNVNITRSISNYSLYYKGKLNSTSGQVTLAYYSNKDILNNDGNIILKSNIEIEDEPQEEPITIINKMALFVNDIVIYFNENNISFYQILIGLFVFNFLVYVICYIVRRF